MWLISVQFQSATKNPQFPNNFFSSPFKNLRTTWEYHKLNILIIHNEYFSALSDPSLILILRKTIIVEFNSAISIIFCNSGVILSSLRYWPLLRSVKNHYRISHAKILSNVTLSLHKSGIRLEFTDIYKVITNFFGIHAILIRNVCRMPIISLRRNWEPQIRFCFGCLSPWLDKMIIKVHSDLLCYV